MQELHCHRSLQRAQKLLFPKKPRVEQDSSSIWCLRRRPAPHFSGCHFGMQVIPRHSCCNLRTNTLEWVGRSWEGEKHFSCFKSCSQLAAKDRNYNPLFLFVFSFQFYALLFLAGWILHEERRFKGKRLACEVFGGMLAQRKQAVPHVAAKRSP